MGTATTTHDTHRHTSEIRLECPGQRCTCLAHANAPATASASSEPKTSCTPSTAGSTSSLPIIPMATDTIAVATVDKNASHEVCPKALLVGGLCHSTVEAASLLEDGDKVTEM